VNPFSNGSACEHGRSAHTFNDTGGVYVNPKLLMAFATGASSSGSSYGCQARGKRHAPPSRGQAQTAGSAVEASRSDPSPLLCPSHVPESCAATRRAIRLCAKSLLPCGPPARREQPVSIGPKREPAGSGTGSIAHAQRAAAPAAPASDVQLRRQSQRRRW